MRGLAILGSTGSIGCATLDVVARHPDRFRVVALAARGTRTDELRRQVRDFRPQFVAVEEMGAWEALRDDPAFEGVEVEVGGEAAIHAATVEGAELVVAAMAGTAGLGPAIHALRAGKDLALANKEALVLGGWLLLAEAEASGAEIRPVDSEHSALFQALGGREAVGVRRLILTASGGPFRNRPLESLSKVTPEEALDHPVWKMGAKVTVDSATLMNKGFEVIEARWLFDVPPERISVLVHPEGAVHGIVEFLDGSMLAQLGSPDMRGPIAYALSCPERIDAGLKRLDLAELGRLTFEPPDLERFRCLDLARQALLTGHAAVIALCAADEVAVDAFLGGTLRFDLIPAVVEATLEETPASEPASLGDVLLMLDEARVTAEAQVEAMR